MSEPATDTVQPTTAAPLRIIDRVVVFDYGEVISLAPSAEAQAEIEAAGGIDASNREAFWESYWRTREPLDEGTVVQHDYWGRIADDIGVTWSLSQRQRLWVADIRGWISMDGGVVDVIDRLWQGGTRLAMLSNAGFEYGGLYRFSPLGAKFERVFVSAEMDLIKPDPEIYRQAATELGITPDQMVFVDNREDNVQVAADLGVVGHHFTSADGLAAFLEELAE